MLAAIGHALAVAAWPVPVGAADRPLPIGYLELEDDHPGAAAKLLDMANQAEHRAALRPWKADNATPKEN